MEVKNMTANKKENKIKDVMDYQRWNSVVEKLEEDIENSKVAIAINEKVLEAACEQRAKYPLPPKLENDTATTQ